MNKMGGGGLFLRIRESSNHSHGLVQQGQGVSSILRLAPKTMTPEELGGFNDDDVAADRATTSAHINRTQNLKGKGNICILQLARRKFGEG